MDRKELINQYKNRERTGGVFVIKNTILNKWYVDGTADLSASKNRFEFMGGTHMKLAADYKAQKGEGFIFEVLEELLKGENQSDKEFQSDIKVLKEIWLEKLAGQEMY